MPTPLTQDYLALVVEMTGKMQKTLWDPSSESIPIDRHLDGVRNDIKQWASSVITDLNIGAQGRKNSLQWNFWRKRWLH
jgi:hypothetical protein